MWLGGNNCHTPVQNALSVDCSFAGVFTSDIVRELTHVNVHWVGGCVRWCLFSDSDSAHRTVVRFGSDSAVG